MTREDVINILYGIRADNLNLNDAYTKDKYEALDMAIKSLEQEPCEDCVSRQAVINGIDNYIEKVQSTGAKDDFISFEELVVKVLPPVAPKQKIGHWIDFGAIEPWFMCSECNERVFGGYKKYCSNCGAKMEGVQE